jgi:hypothetical protein
MVIVGCFVDVGPVGLDLIRAAWIESQWCKYGALSKPLCHFVEMKIVLEPADRIGLRGGCVWTFRGIGRPGGRQNRVTSDHEYTE